MLKTDLFIFQKSFNLSDTAMEFLLSLMNSNGMRYQDLKDITYDPLTNEFKLTSEDKQLSILRYWVERLAYI